ncbi:unnamed protein product, partial [Ixodes persulcatus]
PGRSIQIIKRTFVSSKKTPLPHRPDAAIPRLSLSLTAPSHSPSPDAFRLYPRPALPSSRIFKSGRPPVELSPLTTARFSRRAKRRRCRARGASSCFQRSRFPALPDPRSHPQ